MVDLNVEWQHWYEVMCRLLRKAVSLALVLCNVLSQ